ncbi:MAG: hypothetical protein ACRCTE_13005 [Cellulosilyticaceae bacterium]
MKKNKKTKKKQPFNIYSFMNKNKKTVVGTVSIILVLTMILGVFAQVASTMK